MGKNALIKKMKFRKYKTNMSGIPNFKDTSYGIYPENEQKTTPPLKEGLGYVKTIEPIMRYKKTVNKLK